MWMSEEIISKISSYHLDATQIGRLRCTSTQCNDALRYQHTLQKMARDIFEERRRQPAGAGYDMAVRDEFLLRFDSINPETDSGPVVYFGLEVVYGEHLLIKTTYGWTDGGVSEVFGHKQAMITPSRTSTSTSTTSGSVEITDFETPTRIIDYTDGFDPLLALQWCPLHLE